MTSRVPEARALLAKARGMHVTVLYEALLADLCSEIEALRTFVDAARELSPMRPGPRVEILPAEGAPFSIEVPEEVFMFWAAFDGAGAVQ